MARTLIPVITPGANGLVDALSIQGEGVDLDGTGSHGAADGNGYYFVNPTGRVVLFCTLDEESAVTVTALGVADPYGRGASPDGDAVFDIPVTGTGEFVTFCLGVFTPAMYNQSGVNIRQVFVDVQSLTGTGKLVAMAI